jgi:high-affinity iron transporter
VLFGYQATPSIAQVMVYVFALLMPLAIFYWLNRNPASHSGNKQ